MSNTDLVLGAGKLFFEEAGSSGEIALGNVTEFSFTREQTFDDERGSSNGLIYIRKRRVTQDSVSGRVTTDNMSAENIRLFFSSTDDEQDRGQETADSFVDSFEVRRGRHYQIGRNQFVMGARFVRIFRLFSVRAGREIAFENIRQDIEAGRFEIAKDAPDILDGDRIEIGFFWRRSPDQVLIQSRPRAVEGSLRFIATNRFGPRRDAYFPLVSLNPEGAIDPLVREWMTLSFRFESLKARGDAVYYRTSSFATTTKDEEAILDNGLSFEQFTLLEEDFDVQVNTRLPSILGA